MRILDVGCGGGQLGEELLQNGAREVVGITYSPQEAATAALRLSEVHCANVNDFEFAKLGKFDCVILSHVLEHLYDPQETLMKLKAALTSQAVVIVALPNVLWWKQRLQFLLGRWRYQDSGVLDRTHFRFFDRHSATQLLCDSGYEIVEQLSQGPFPPLKPVRTWLGPRAIQIDQFTSAIWPGLLAMQFVFVARPKAT
jgi:2-polyprenyl-3-methyl-5-hydroxy-6-metoxy-1,4-benzoquinol methylase